MDDAISLLRAVTFLAGILWAIFGKYRPDMPGPAWAQCLVRFSAPWVWFMLIYLEEKDDE